MELGEKIQSSAYNEGMLQIQRLHFLWVEVNNYSRSGQYQKWRWTLDAVWRELSRDAIRKDLKQVKPEDFQEKVSKNKWFMTYENHNKKIAEAKKPEAHYAALMQLEIFLRYLQDYVGKGGKYKRHDDDDIE